MGESRVVIPIFGILDVTGEVIGMWVVLAAVAVISLLATRHMRERPGKFQNVIETGVEYLDNYFAGILGKKESRKHFLFLGSLFIFIIFGNYTGLTDYWKAPTSSLSVTLGLGIITFFYLQGSSIHAHGFLGYLKRFISPIAIMLPLLLLDEIDKVSTDYKGDTFSALLEVLDSEQNNRFRDHYLEVPVDLSEVTFVTTANSLQTIPRPLLDRMEVIEVSSYTENEKLHIATEHLIPKQLERHGLTKEQLTISKGVIWKIAQNYTKEAGVRQMEREIGNICRKAAREIYEHDKKRVQVTERNIEKYLGKEKYTYQMANAEDEVGIVRGLAWTSVGGDTLQIEVNVMPGKGEIILTGQLGDVMKESAQAGISYIRSISSKYKVAEDFFEKHDIHIHIPEGAVPKDGPSAGITMATAMLSAITDKKVRADLAMTGEITLRGRVLPIGGLKEKLLAAKNAGIRTVLVPRENKKDVDELSSEITKGLEIIPVSQMEEVLKIALMRTRRKKDGN